MAAFLAVPLVVLLLFLVGRRSEREDNFIIFKASPFNGAVHLTAIQAYPLATRLMCCPCS